MKKIESWKSFDGEIFETESQCRNHETDIVLVWMQSIFAMLEVIMRTCKECEDCSFCELKEEEDCPLLKYKDICKQFAQFVENDCPYIIKNICTGSKENKE